MTLPARTTLANEDLLPVPPDRRTWTWWHMASLWIGMVICIPTYILAAWLIDQGWTWQSAVGAVILGNLIAFVPIALTAHAGARYGIPFPVLARSSFGVIGADVPALLRGLVACAWFGIQTWIGGWAIYKLIEVVWPGIATLPPVLPASVGLNTGELIGFLLFWALNLWFALRGVEPIKLLEARAAPFLLLIGAVALAWSIVRVGGVAPMLQNGGGQTLANGRGLAANFGVGLSSAVAFSGMMALTIPDLSRFARSQRDQLVGQAIGLPGTMALFAFISAAVTNATVIIFHQRIADPIVLLARLGGPLMIIPAMTGLTVATLTTNVAANIVAPANSIVSLAPDKLTFTHGALLATGLGAVMMPWRLYHEPAAYLLAWLLGIGALLAPIVGITVADYVVRRGVLNVNDLYKRHGVYEYTRGVNWLAVGAFLLAIVPSLPGFLAALRDGGAPHPGTFGAIYRWAWLVSFLVAAVVYVVGMRVSGADRRTPVEVGEGAGD
jgi:NCS1 family nucleobase:cation symporter-1